MFVCQCGGGELRVERVVGRCAREGGRAVRAPHGDRRAGRPRRGQLPHGCVAMEDQRCERVQRAAMLTVPDEACASSNGRTRPFSRIGRPVVLPLSKALESVRAIAG
jgi:hypothetical protein